MLENYYKCWGCDQRNETVKPVDLEDDVCYYCETCREHQEERSSYLF